MAHGYVSFANMTGCYTIYARRRFLGIQVKQEKNSLLFKWES
jgi:hypothetical protein